MLQAATGHRRGGGEGDDDGRSRRLTRRRLSLGRLRRPVPSVVRALSPFAAPLLGVLGLVVSSVRAPGLLFLHAGLAPQPVSAGMLTGRVVPVVVGAGISGLGLVLGARRPGVLVVSGAVLTTLGVLLLLTPYSVLVLLPTYTTYFDLACSGMALLLGVLQLATGLACRLARTLGTAATPRDPFVPLIASIVVFGGGLVAVLVGLGRWWDVVLSRYEADLRVDTLVLVLGGCLMLTVAVMIASLHWSAGVASGLLAGVLPGLFLLYSSSRDNRPLRSRLPAEVASGYHLAVGVPVLVGVLAVASAVAVLVARQQARGELRAFSELVARVGRER